MNAEEKYLSWVEIETKYQPEEYELTDADRQLGELLNHICTVAAPFWLDTDDRLKNLCKRMMRALIDIRYFRKKQKQLYRVENETIGTLRDTIAELEAEIEGATSAAVESKTCIDKLRGENMTHLRLLNAQKDVIIFQRAQIKKLQMEIVDQESVMDLDNSSKQDEEDWEESLAYAKDQQIVNLTKANEDQRVEIEELRECLAFKDSSLKKIHLATIAQDGNIFALAQELRDVTDLADEEGRRWTEAFYEQEQVSAYELEEQSRINRRLSMEVQGLGMEISSHAQETHDSDQRLKHASSQLQQLKGTVVVLENDLERANASTRSARTRLIRAQTELVYEETRRRRVEEANQSLRQELSELTQTCSSKDALLMGAKRRLIRAGKELRDEETRSRRAQDRITASHNRETSLRQEINRASIIENDRRVTAEDTIAKLGSEIRECNATITQLQANNRSLGADLQSAEAAIKGLRVEVDWAWFASIVENGALLAAEDRIQTLTATVQDRDLKIESLALVAQGANERLTDQIDILESRLAKQLDTLEGQRGMFEAYREMQELRYAELYAKALTIHRWVQYWKKKLEQMTADRNDYQESLRNRNGEFDLLLLEYNKLNHQIEGREADVVKYKKLGVCLANALTHANKIRGARKQKIGRLIPALQESKHEFQALSADYHSKTEQLAAVKDRHEEAIKRMLQKSRKVSTTLNHRNYELDLLIVEYLSVADQAHSLRRRLAEMDGELLRINAEHQAEVISLTSTKDAAVAEAERLDAILQRAFVQLERLKGIIEGLQAESPQPPSVLGKRKAALGSTRRLRPRK